MSAVLADESLERIKLSARYADLPDNLFGTDRILKRWAVSVGDGTQDLSWLEIAKSRMPPLDDQTAIVVDQLILRAPTRVRLTVQRWYRFPDNDLSDIAAALRIRRELVKVHWHLALVYCCSRFLESPLSSLRKLAQTNPAECRISLATSGTEM